MASGPPGQEGTDSLTGHILGPGDDEDAGPTPGVARAVLTLLVIVTVLAIAGFAAAFATGAFG